VRYGANSSWYYGTCTDGVLCTLAGCGTCTDGVWCTNTVWKDPLYLTVKSCQILR
jgi:hypothetical protein